MTSFNERIKELIAIKILTPLKILTQENIMQTSDANSEHKHSEIEHFSASKERISQKSSSLSIVDNFSDLH